MERMIEMVTEANRTLVVAIGQILGDQQQQGRVRSSAVHIVSGEDREVGGLPDNGEGFLDTLDATYAY